MKIGFVGCGRVACSLSLYIRKRGGFVSGFLGHHAKRAESDANHVGARAFSNYGDLLSACDLVFIATPDDCIARVAQEIAQFAQTMPTPDKALRRKIFCHLSGVHSSKALDVLAKFNATVASLHPMAAVSSKEFDFTGVSFTLDAAGPEIVPLKSWLDAMGIQYNEIAGKDKPLYHAAACILSNYSVTLFSIAQKLLEEAHIPADVAHAMLLCLLQATVSNLETKRAGEALTGPITRGDRGTIQKHLDALYPYPEILDLYSSLARQTARLAEDNGRITTQQKNDLMEVLKHGQNHDENHS